MDESEIRQEERRALSFNVLTSIVIAFSGQTPMSRARKRHSKSAGISVLKWQLYLQARSGH
jgi:hypothetical protein